MEKRLNIILVILILLIVIVSSFFLLKHINSNNKIEEKNNKITDNFEIIFHDKSSEIDGNYIPIISKGELAKYDYNVYSQYGIVDIIINGETLSLRDALLNNKITMEEIIAKANSDFEDNAIKTAMFDDGGTIEYLYSTYTLIKRHTLLGDRDVYFMPPKNS